MLGKVPAGSEVIAIPANLSALLALSNSLKNDPEASSECFRCVANALLLIDGARVTWVEKEVGGGEACVDLLEVRTYVTLVHYNLIFPSQNATTPDEIFLASRLLFLCTASLTSSGAFIQSLVEGRHVATGRLVIDIIGAKIDVLIVSIVTGAKMAREAMTDLLKFIFNLLVHYPKVVLLFIYDKGTDISAAG